MAKFQHPGIVSVYDAGETPSGLLYIVMEFIEGTDVAQMVKSQGKLPPDARAGDHGACLRCAALRAQHGVIHRDIKPANIMLNMEGAGEGGGLRPGQGRRATQGGLTKSEHGDGHAGLSRAGGADHGARGSTAAPTCMRWA